MSAEPADGTGVIHDIGYRHYPGARLGRAHIVRSLYVDGIRGAFGLGRSARSKVMPFLLLAAMCLPAVIMAVITGVTGADQLPVSYFSYFVQTSLILSIYVAAVSPALVSRDLRFRTISLYYSRPLRRDDYVLARLAAAVTAVYALLALPLSLLYAGALLAKLPVMANTEDYLLAMVGALVLAVVLSGIGLLIASVTPRRGFGVAAVVTVLLVLAAIGSILQSVAVDENRITVAGYLGLVNPFAIVDGLQVWAFGADSSYPAEPPGTTGGLVFLAVALAVIAASVGLLLLRYRKVSVS